MEKEEDLTLEERMSRAMDDAFARVCAGAICNLLSFLDIFRFFCKEKSEEIHTLPMGDR